MAFIREDLESDVETYNFTQVAGDNLWPMAVMFG
jgi:hypothetical protein